MTRGRIRADFGEFENAAPKKLTLAQGSSTVCDCRPSHCLAHISSRAFIRPLNLVTEKAVMSFQGMQPKKAKGGVLHTRKKPLRASRVKTEQPDEADGDDNNEVAEDEAGVSDDNNTEVKTEAVDQCRFCDCALTDPTSVAGNHLSGCPRFVPAPATPPPTLALHRPGKRSRIADTSVLNLDSWVRAMPWLQLCVPALN